MVTEALKAARDFIENDRQALAESLTVNGEIVFEDDIDRGAMAEYVKVLAVIDRALNPPQTQESPFDIGQRLRQEGKGISDLWGAVGNDANMPEAQRGFDSAALAAQPAVPLTDEQRRNLWVSATIESPSHENCYYRGIADSEAYHGITKGGAA
jgi:hypothetical protein